MAHEKVRCQNLYPKKRKRESAKGYGKTVNSLLIQTRVSALATPPLLADPAERLRGALISPKPLGGGGHNVRKLPKINPNSSEKKEARFRAFSRRWKRSGIFAFFRIKRFLTCPFPAVCPFLNKISYHLPWPHPWMCLSLITMPL